MRIPLLAVAVLLALAGCSEGSADELRQYLADELQLQPGYSAINDVTVEGGDVEIATTLQGFEYSTGEEMCTWASIWLFDDGNGEEDSRIRVLDKNGRELVGRDGSAGSCG